MAELFKKPSLQATVSPAGWRSIKVATQQAPESPLINLAKSLNVAGKIGQQYAGLEAFEYKQGVKEGQIAAASADLDEAIEGLDAAGEKLVEQGLMPRSQLFGYQKGFRKHIGQREAKANFFGGLQGRLKEVEMNPENGNYDIIDQIIQEEETASIERLRQAGGSELALQGFSEFSSEIKDRFKIQATQNRDKAIQKFNNNMYIEDFNQEFGERLTEATTPEDIATLQSDLKITMDNMTSQGKIPRSKVVELFFNGFMVPNLNNLLVADNPQPDKAEKMLDALLDIDLTGKGGKLGNINREGAYIRSKAVELRNKIETARDSIEKDEEVKSRDIVKLYMPAATTVMSGLSKNEDIAQFQISEVVDFLKDAGWDEEYANNRAMELIRSQDIAALRLEGLKYRENDSTKGAWNAATGSIQRFTIDLVAKSEAVMSKVEMAAALDDVEAAVALNPETNVVELLASKKITDPRVKADALALSREAKSNLWLEKTETYKNYEGQFEDTLDGVIDTDVFEGEAADTQRQYKASGRAGFQEKYIRELRRLQTSLKEDPDRDVKIAARIPAIIEDIKDKWRDYKKVEKQFMEGQFNRIAEAEAGKEVYELPTVPELEEAQENIEDVLTSWLTDFTKQFPKKIGKYELLATELPATLEGRLQAFEKAELVERELLKEEYKDSNALKEGLQTIREFYGFRHPREISSDMAVDLDFRYTPMYESKEMLTEDVKQVYRELKSYMTSPAALDIEKFPMFNLYNTKFGIATEEQLRIFKEEQLRILSTKNR